MAQQQQQTSLRPIAPQKLGKAQVKSAYDNSNSRGFGSMENSGKPYGSTTKPLKMKTPAKITKPTIKKAPKRSKKAPTYEQVQKSVKKTMGY